KLDVGDRMRDTSAGGRRIALDSIQEVRAGEDARDTGANPVVEGAASLPCPLVERHRGLDVCRCHRTPVRAVCEVSKDFRGAAGLVQSRAGGTGAFRRHAAGWVAMNGIRGCGMAYEEQLAARPFADSLHVV